MIDKDNIFEDLQEGLYIENKSWNLKWGTPLSELIPFCETSSVNSDNLPWLNLGTLSIFNGLELTLVTPFDTMQANNGEFSLNHLGQNLNLDDISKLVAKLTERLGIPINSSDEHGMLREWRQGNIYIKIAPRSAHGSDWSSIIIGKETTYNKT
jgi:hypothetical protein